MAASPSPIAAADTTPHLSLQEWIAEQRSSAGVPVDQPNVWVQVQLDGSVRTSGRGIPPWEKLLEELPPLDSIRSTLLDGIGTSV